MPPTSRGLLLLRLSHRTPPPRLLFPRPKHASSSKQAIKIPNLRPKSRPKPAAPTGKPADSPPKLPEPHKPPHSSRLVFVYVRRNEAFKLALLILPWLPIVAVAIHHAPLG